jgi:hypothetical protein
LKEVFWAWCCNFVACLFCYFFHTIYLFLCFFYLYCFVLCPSVSLRRLIIINLSERSFVSVPLSIVGLMLWFYWIFYAQITQASWLLLRLCY